MSDALPAERHYIAIADDEAKSLGLEQDACPAPGAGEVLIRVAFAGINRADLLQRRGLYPPPADASPILGLEVAGTVLACGDGVSGWSPGDPVCALTHGGGYADARSCTPAFEARGTHPASCGGRATAGLIHGAAGAQPRRGALPRQRRLR